MFLNTAEVETCSPFRFAAWSSWFLIDAAENRGVSVSDLILFFFCSPTSAV
jgi:hypothetical protein